MTRSMLLVWVQGLSVWAFQPVRAGRAQVKHASDRMSAWAVVMNVFWNFPGRNQGNKCSRFVGPE